MWITKDVLKHTCTYPQSEMMLQLEMTMITRKQKHRPVKDNAYRQDLSVYREWCPRMVLITMSIMTMRSISRKLGVGLFTLCKISNAILRILWRHLQADLRNV